MIGRVAGTIAGWGREGAYFASEEDAEASLAQSDLPPASDLVSEIEQFLRQQRPE